MLLLFLCIAVSILLTVADAVSIPVVILHSSHEGSHVIGEALGKYPCVAFIAECFAQNHHVDNLSQTKVTQIYFDSKGLDVFKLLNALPTSCHQRVFETETKIAELKICQQNNHPILVPVLYRGSITALCPELRVFPLIRADLMRHALSSSSEEAAALGKDHPHFSKDPIELIRHKFTLSLLNETTKAIVSARRVKVNTAWKLAKLGLACSSLKFIFYEDFLDDQDGFVFRLFRASLGKHFDPVVHKPLSNVEDAVTVKRIHPADISTFVENSAEVLNFFLMEPFPAYRGYCV